MKIFENVRRMLDAHKELRLKERIAAINAERCWIISDTERQVQWYNTALTVEDDMTAAYFYEQDLREKEARLDELNAQIEKLSAR